MSEAKIENKDNKHPFVLNRLDRSVADNLRDIERSFGIDAGIVTDFIIFVTTRLKQDIFGFTVFTLNDFCKQSGRHKQDLCAVHPAFVNQGKGKKEMPPEIGGHKFVTVFDYALYNMLQKNIIFSKSYDYNEDGKIISLTNFPILKDVRLNVDRHSNAIKFYEIRVSDEILHGFLQRYYTIETNGYRQVGKGRGGDGRKRLFIFLGKTRHMLLSKKQFKAKYPLDYLASIAGREVKEDRNRKTSMKRILDTMLEKGKIPFEYKFVQGDPSIKYQEDYWVELDFSCGSNIAELTERRGDNLFYRSLIEDLKKAFKSIWKDIVIEDEKDTFQRWLVNNNADLDTKANIYCTAYYRAYGEKLTIGDAKQLIREGILKED